MTRTAAYLRLAQLNGWDDNEADADAFRALRSWARNHAVLIRLCLIEPAEPDQIADALSILADVLNQDVSERTAAFIIEMVGNAKLPFYVVSFTRLLQGAEARLRTVKNATRDVRGFVNHLEPALTYFQEHLSGDDSQPGMAGVRVAGEP